MGLSELSYTMADFYSSDVNITKTVGDNLNFNEIISNTTKSHGYGFQF